MTIPPRAFRNYRQTIGLMLEYFHFVPVRPREHLRCNRQRAESMHDSLLCPSQRDR